MSEGCITSYFPVLECSIEDLDNSLGSLLKYRYFLLSYAILRYSMGIAVATPAIGVHDVRFCEEFSGLCPNARGPFRHSAANSGSTASSSRAT